jgi:transposase
MKVQEVILRAIDGRLKWYQAAEILGISDRQMRRWKQRYEQRGYDGLFDRRRQQPSPKRVPLEVLRQVLTWYRDRYYDLNVLHFYEKLPAHGIRLSYTWVKNALQTAGLIAKDPRRSPHRKARPRRPLPGMLLFADASTHAWIPGLEGKQDLIVVLDDANSEVYYARFVPEETTLTMMASLRAVIEHQGLFCTLYTDKAGHFTTTRTGRSPHRRQQALGPTQIERALGQLGIELLPAHSPQARGRMERLWETWQGRLPQELRLAGITTMEAANAFLQHTWISFHNRTWTVAPASEGTAFVPYQGDQLDRIFAAQHERTVTNDNCIEFQNRRFQIPPTPWRYTFAKCRVKVYEHLDGTLSIGYGPHTLAHYDSEARLLLNSAITAQKPMGGNGTSPARISSLPACGGGRTLLTTGHLICYKNRTS